MSDEDSSRPPVRSPGARRPRSLLTSAAIGATGAMLVACGSNVGAAPDPVPLPGNPKGSHFDDNASNEVLVSGTIEASAIPEGQLKTAQAVFVSIRGPAGPPLAAKKLPAGPFPMTFELTGEDLVPMGGDRPVPDSFTLKVALDTDGDAMSNDGLGEYRGTVQKGKTAIEVAVLPLPPKPRMEREPVGNPKGSMYDDALKREIADPKLEE